MAVELEYETATFFIGPEFQGELDAKAADGWEIMAGTRPVAVYQLVRMKKPEQVTDMGGFGQLKIDESKIFHLRGGKVVDGKLVGARRVNPDGTLGEEYDADAPAPEGKVHDGGASFG